jgi:hypothetical protein
MDVLDYATNLQKEIKDLEYFIKYIIDKKKKKLTFKKQITKWSLFGYHFFGCGAFTKEIPVPECIVNEIGNHAKELLILKQKEYSEIWNKKIGDENG